MSQWRGVARRVRFALLRHEVERGSRPILLPPPRRSGCQSLSAPSPRRGKPQSFHRGLALSLCASLDEHPFLLGRRLCLSGSPSLPLHGFCRLHDEEGIAYLALLLILTDPADWRAPSAPGLTGFRIPILCCDFLTGEFALLLSVHRDPANLSKVCANRCQFLLKHGRSALEHRTDFIAQRQERLDSHGLQLLCHWKPP